MSWCVEITTPLHDFKTIYLGILVTLPAYLLSGQAWNFSGMGIIWSVIKSSNSCPMSFFSESDVSGSFAFKTSNRYAERWFQPAGNFWGVNPRLQGDNRRHSIDGSKASRLICISLNWCRISEPSYKPSKILVSQTQPPWKKTHETAKSRIP